MPSPPLPLFSLSTQSNPPLKKPSPSPVPPPRLLRTCRTSPKQHLQCPIPTVCKEKRKRWEKRWRRKKRANRVNGLSPKQSSLQDSHQSNFQDSSSKHSL